MTHAEQPFDYEGRTRACQDALATHGADCVVLSPGPNTAYLSGFVEEPMERHLLLFVARDGDPLFLAPTMYEGQLESGTWVKRLRLWDDGDDPGAVLEDVVERLDLAGGHVLVDDRMWALFTQDLRAALPDASFGLASEVLAELRVHKTDAELSAMRRAAAVADEVSEEIGALGPSAIGLTESELAREIEDRLVDHGGSGTAFETIVGSGPNGANPHHRHGERTIKVGDPVVLDFGTRVDGYPSDQTRTVVFDRRAADETEQSASLPVAFETVFETVREAQQAAVRTVEPGVPAEAVDRAARDVIEGAGYGDAFVHRTGHGVGLEVHEPPYIVAGNDRELESGMVFSVEPGIYLEGEFGVRIEDLVAVTDEGCERLNESTRTYTRS